MRIKLALALAISFALFGATRAMADSSAPSEPQNDTICGLIAAAAEARGLPVSFLTRLIWQESRFQPGITSPAGAQGIAQFMPGTAVANGLANPYDPEQAIPKAADLTAALKTQFGNLGLAAAAYNAGPGRVAAWLANGVALPAETQAYVAAVAGRPLEDWIGGGAATKASESELFPVTTCPAEVAVVRTSTPTAAAQSALTAPWGVQIGGSFSKPAALAAYRRTQALYAAMLGNLEPMVIGGRAPGRGFVAFYRVRAPAASRAEGDALCGKIRRGGGACVVLRN